jgi:hypothetical protein
MGTRIDQSLSTVMGENDDPPKAYAGPRGGISPTVRAGTPDGGVDCASAGVLLVRVQRRHPSPLFFF